MSRLWSRCLGLPPTNQRKVSESPYGVVDAENPRENANEYLNLCSTRSGWPYASAAEQVLGELMDCEGSEVLRHVCDMADEAIVEPLLAGENLLLVRDTDELMTHARIPFDQFLNALKQTS